MIELKNITASAGKFLLSDISLKADYGEFHVLLGPSGSGKSVLLETITGLKKPCRGLIFLNGRDVTLLAPEKRHIAYLPQDYALFPHKNVFENIAFGLRIRNKTGDQFILERVREIAAMLDITMLLNRNCSNLSGGEAQRVALARALVLDNSILLLDEPTSALQETMQESFCLLLKEIRQQYKLTVLMATHHKDSAYMLADTLHFIGNGKLLSSIRLSELKQRPLPAPVAAILGISNIFSMTAAGSQRDYFYCRQLNAAFILSGYSGRVPDTFQLGVKPDDIRLVMDNIHENNQTNVFTARAMKIIDKETDSIVYLTVPETGFEVKMMIPTYTLKKSGVKTCDLVRCRIKGEYARVIN